MRLLPHPGHGTGMVLVLALVMACEAGMGFASVAAMEDKDFTSVTRASTLRVEDWREEAFDATEEQQEDDDRLRVDLLMDRTAKTTAARRKQKELLQEEEQQQQDDGDGDDNDDETPPDYPSRGHQLRPPMLRSFSPFSSRNFIAAGMCMLGAFSSIYALLVEQFKLDRSSFSKFSVATKIPVEVLCLSGPLVLVSSIIYFLLSALILLDGSAKYVFFISASWSAIVIDMSFVMYENVSDVLGNRIDLTIHMVNAFTVANAFSQLTFFPYTFVLSGTAFWAAIILMRVASRMLLARGPREHDDSGVEPLSAATLVSRRLSGMGRPSSP